MKTWSLYDPKTGLFTGETITGGQISLRDNLPAGIKAIEGRFDHLSYRVDLQSGRVVGFRPPQPDADHEWDDALRRWVLNAAAAARQLNQRRVQNEIDALEKAQLRPSRELAINPENTDAKRRLLSIESQIGELRKTLSASVEDRTDES